MPKELDFENLRFCLDNYQSDFLYIRDCGGIRENGEYSWQGLTKVNENLNGRILDFRLENGLDMLIDDKRIFHFDLEDYYKGFSLAYERFFEDGRMYIPGGIPNNPDDENLPKPRRSYLRTILDSHLMEIFFRGKVPIKFHSWREKPYWKDWTIDKTKKI